MRLNELNPVKTTTILSTFIDSLDQIIRFVVPFWLQKISYEPVTALCEGPRQSGLQLFIPSSTFSALLLHSSNKTTLRQANNDTGLPRQLELPSTAYVPSPTFDPSAIGESISFKEESSEAMFSPKQSRTTHPMPPIENAPITVTPISRTGQIPTSLPHLSSQQLKQLYGGLADRLQRTSQITTPLQTSLPLLQYLPTPIPTPITLRFPKFQDNSTRTQPFPDQTISTSQPQILHPQTSQTKRKVKRKDREKPLLPTWEYHYKRLFTQITPIDEIHRDHPIYRKIWETSYSRNQKYQFRTPKSRLTSQHNRLAYIFRLRKQLSHESHISRTKSILQRKMNERLYKLAYLQFKMRRLELLKKMGKLRRAYKMGWTADREWQSWKRVAAAAVAQQGGMRKWVWKKKRRRGLAFDEGQRRAERRFFDMF